MFCPMMVPSRTFSAVNRVVMQLCRYARCAP
jgi:hypothetical protein